jgi:ornithine cyclodeaminase
MKFISNDDITAKVNIHELTEALRIGHALAKAHSERSLLVDPKITSDPKNQLLISPAWQSGQALGVKLTAIFPGNTAKFPELANENGLYILFDQDTGVPKVALQSDALTRLKTAADSMLAASFLARKGAENILILGSGPIAYQFAHAYRFMFPNIKRFFIWNRTQAKAAGMAQRLSADEIFSTVQVQQVTDLQTTVGKSDIIVCATSANEPLVKGAWVSAGTHIDLVGAYTPQMRESDDELIKRAIVCVDTRELTITGCGDLCSPISNGVIDEAHIVADLYQLCHKEHLGRQHDSQITLFKNSGGPHLDLMAAQYIAQAVQ